MQFAPPGSRRAAEATPTTTTCSLANHARLHAATCADLPPSPGTGKVARSGAGIGSAGSSPNEVVTAFALPEPRSPVSSGRHSDAAHHRTFWRLDAGPACFNDGRRAGRLRDPAHRRRRARDAGAGAPRCATSPWATSRRASSPPRPALVSGIVDALNAAGDQLSAQRRGAGAAQGGERLLPRVAGAGLPRGVDPDHRREPPGALLHLRALSIPATRWSTPSPWNNNHYVHLAGARGVPIITRARRRVPPHPRAARGAGPRGAAAGAQLAAQPVGHGVHRTALGDICDLVLEENARRGPGERPLYLLYDPCTGC